MVEGRPVLASVRKDDQRHQLGVTFSISLSKISLPVRRVLESRPNTFFSCRYQLHFRAQSLRFRKSFEHDL